MVVLSSPAGDLQLPSVKNLTEFVLDRISTFGDKIAVIDQKLNKHFTFRDIASNIMATAYGFRQLGIKPGDVICMFTPNCVEYYYVLFAVAMLRATVTTANPNLTQRELVYQLKASNATWIIVAPSSAEVGLKGMAEAGLDTNSMLCLGKEKIPVIKNFIEILAFGHLTNGDVNACSLEDVFNLPFSSGTTGLSKGCKVTQRSFVAHVTAHSHPLFEHLYQEDIMVTFLPFYHLYAQISILTVALCKGITNIIMDKFDLATYLGLISRHRATVSYIVPSVAVLLAKSPAVENYDLSSLRLLVSSAAVLTEESEQEIKKRLPHTAIWQVFGMTETCIVFSSTNNGHKSGSTGRIYQGFQVKVVSLTTGDVMSENKEGEIWIKGPGLMKSYLNNNESECFTPDGWFKSGDVGYFDEDQYFFITDRVKDLIKYNGLQVAPAELESLLLSHPSIADAAVIGMPHSTTGEVPKAYVVLKPGNTTVTPLDIQEFIAQQVAYFKQLRGGVEIVDQIPKSPVGKILKNILRQQSVKSNI